VASDPHRDPRRVAARLRSAGGFAASVAAARVEMAAGFMSDARRDLADALRSAPAAGHSIESLLQVAVAAGAWPVAAAAATRAIALHPSAENYLAAARAAFELHDAKRGLAAVAEATRRDGSDPRVLEAAELLDRHQLHAEAAAAVRGLLEHKPASRAAASVWRRLGTYTERAGSWREAGAAWLYALDVEPTVLGRRALGADSLALYRRHRGLALLAHQLEDAHSVARLALRGEAEAELNQPERARASYEAALRLDPSDPELLSRVAALARSPSERVDLFRRLFEAHADEPRYGFALAEAQLGAGATASALETVASVAERFVAVASVQEQAASLCTAHQQIGASLPYRVRVSELDHDQPEAAFALAETYRGLRRSAEAAAAYREFLKRAHYDRPAYDRVVARAGALVEVRPIYEEALAHWPADLGLRRRFAGWLETIGDVRAALAAWKDVAAKSTAPFAASQAQFHVKQLEQKLLVEDAGRATTR
jgi:tetratricopeptide (TPR) repeat protein